MSKKKKTKKASPVKSQKGLELQYKKELNKLGQQLINVVNKELLVFLKNNQKEYTGDGIGDELNTIFRRLNSLLTGTITAGFAKNTAIQMVQKVDKNNKRRFGKSIKSITGIDPSSIIKNEGLEDFLELSRNKNEILIKSLPEEYLKSVETIITNGVINGDRYSEIAKKITARVGSANSKLAGRIKTIAMNEVQTMNAQITLKRNDALGIKRGIYMTSKDERVRECHAELNGVEYDLKKGAWSKKCQKFIQPGITDINCRCSFQPIIEVD